MRRNLPLALSVPAIVLVLGCTAIPAAAAMPTTPVPTPVNSHDPPVSKAQGPQPLGHAVGDAGAAVGDLQVLPGLVNTDTILPGFGDKLPKKPVLEGGIGLSSAQANSEAYLSYEKAIAESSPVGGSVGGNSPKLPGSLSQTALPDNKKAVHGGLKLPHNPLLNVGLLEGSAHARYSKKLGPCVKPLSDASTKLAGLSAGDLDLPNLKDNPLSQVLNPSKLKQLPSKVQKTLEKAPGKGGVNGAKALAALTPKANQDDSKQAKSKSGGISLISVPKVSKSHSRVNLVGMKGSKNKAVKSTSTFDLADVTVFKGLGPLETKIKVASQPKLTALSTGKKSTSKVHYSAPALEVDPPFGGPPIKVDARHPFKTPIALPLPGATKNSGLMKEFNERFGKSLADLQGLPIVGDMAKFLQQKGGSSSGFSLNLGLIKLSIGDLQQKGQVQKKGKDKAPFSGFQQGATANMMKLDILPTDMLKLKDAPKALASLTFGKQVARAYAPTGGVKCGTTSPGTSGKGKPKPQGKAKPKLAYTSGAYHTIPLFWTGTGLLLAGAVLIAALPTRRRRAGKR